MIPLTNLSRFTHNFPPDSLPSQKRYYATSLRPREFVPVKMVFLWHDQHLTRQCDGASLFRDTVELPTELTRKPVQAVECAEGLKNCGEIGEHERCSEDASVGVGRLLSGVGVRRRVGTEKEAGVAWQNVSGLVVKQR